MKSINSLLKYASGDPIAWKNIEVGMIYYHTSDPKSRWKAIRRLKERIVCVKANATIDREYYTFSDADNICFYGYAHEINQ